MTIQEALRQAADLLRAVKLTLDDSSTKCECCNARRFRNYPDTLLRRKVEGAEGTVIRTLADIARAPVADGWAGRDLRDDIPEREPHNPLP